MNILSCQTCTTTEIGNKFYASLESQNVSADSKHPLKLKEKKQFFSPSTVIVKDVLILHA